jgi:hypothetical protein
MPVEIQRLEEGIYHSAWQGVVAIEEAFGAMDAVIASVRQNQEQRAVLILDMTTCTQIPFDVSNMRRLTEMDARVIAFVLVKGNIAAQMLVRMLDKLSKRTFEQTETLPEAVRHAHNLLGDVTRLSREILLRRAGLR